MRTRSEILAEFKCAECRGVGRYDVPDNSDWCDYCDGRGVDPVAVLNACVHATRVLDALRGAEHCAWLRYQGHANGVTTIHVCDSDSPGAFRVHNLAAALKQAEREAKNAPA